MPEAADRSGLAHGADGKGMRARGRGAVARTSATKAELERELRELRRENAQLSARLEHELARSRALSEANRRVALRLETAMDRIKSLLVS